MCTEGRRNRLILLLSVVAVVLVLGAPLVIADYASAADPSGDIKDTGQNKIGTWSYNTSNKTMVLNATVSSGVPEYFNGLSGDFSDYTVTVTGFQDTSAIHDAIVDKLGAAPYNIPSSSITYTQDIVGASGAIGTWSYDGTTLTLNPSSSTTEVPVGLVGFTQGASTTDVIVTATISPVTCFKSNISDFIRTETNNGVSIVYRGQLPDWTNAKGNIWEYDDDHTLTVSSNNSGVLYNSYGANSTTLFNGMFFTESTTDIVIHNYTSGGAYLFKDFSNATTISSDSLTSLSSNLLKTNGNVSTVQNLNLTQLSTINNSTLNNNKVLVNLYAPNLATISASAFSGCSNLETITFSSTLTTIDSNTFLNCTNLSSIDTGNILKINSGAFQGCTSLQSLNTLNVQKIESSAFKDSGLTTLTLSDCDSIGSNAFEGCSSLTTVAMGTKLQSIGSNAFYNSGISGTVNFPGTLKSVGSYAFMNCTALSKVNFNSTGNLDIGTQAFIFCTGLTDLQLKSTGNICLGNSSGDDTYSGVFAGCTALQDIDFDAPQIVIGNKCFDGCRSIQVLDFTKCGVTIKAEAFIKSNIYVKNAWYENCAQLSSLREVKFGSYASSIGNSAFGSSTASNACIALEYLDLGTNVTSIGNSAFYNCTALKGSKIVADVVQPLRLTTSLTSIGTDSFRNCISLRGLDIADDCKITTLPDSCFNGDTSIAGAITIPNKVESIASNAFYNCSSITGVTMLSPELSQISTNAFRKCTSLETVTINGTKLETMQSSVFNECTRLTTVTIQNTILKTIKNNAFRDCTSLVNFTIDGSSLETIEYEAFRGCTNLEHFNFTSTNLKEIQYLAFYECKKLQSFNFDNSKLTDIGREAFRRCYVMTGDYTFPSTLETIGYSAFYDCWALGDIVFDSTIVDGQRIGIKKIEYNAFANGWNDYNTYRGIKSVVIPDTLIFLGNGAFQYATRMTSAVIGWNSNGSNEAYYTGEFGTDTFRGCFSMTTVTIHEGITNIGIGCFAECRGLETATLPDSVLTIPKYSFYNCHALTSIDLKHAKDIGNPEYNSNEDNLRAFYNCKELTSVKAAYAENVYYRAFELCPKLTNVEFGTTLTNFAVRAFYVGYGDSTPINTITSIVLHETGTRDVALYSNGLYVDSVLVLYCNGLTDSVSIRDGTRAINDCVFYKSKVSGKVTIPASVRSVGPMAFYDCNSITEVEILSTTADLFTLRVWSGTVQESRAFANCDAIRTITFPISVKIANVFNRNDAYEAIGNNLSAINVIGNGQSGLGNYYQTYYSKMPWYTCGGNSRIILTFSDRVSSVDPYMFYGCTRLQRVYLGENTTTIGERAFYNCSNLLEIRLSSSLVTSGNNAFGGCTAVTDLYCPVSFDATQIDQKFQKLVALTIMAGTNNAVDYTNSNYSGTPWNNNTNGFNLVFQDDVVSIGSYMFYGSNIKSISFNDGLENIGEYAFYGLTNSTLTTLDLPEEIRSIGVNAFSSCTYLTTAYLPVTFNFSVNIFDGCTRLTTFYFTTGTDGVGHPYSTASVTETVWYIKSQDSAILVYFEEGVKSVGSFMFYRCSSLSGGSALGIASVEFPDSLISIGDSAFLDCSNMSTVDFGNGVTTIGNRAFAGCSSIGADLVLPGTLVSVGAGAFSGCVNIISLTIPISVNAVADNSDPAFGGCTRLSKYYFIGSCYGYSYDDSDISDSYYGKAPWNVNSVTRITFTDVKSIGDHMFHGMRFPSSAVELPDSVTSIGNYAFAETTNLTKVYNTSGQAIADLTIIGEYAFYNSELVFFNSTSVVSLASITSIGEYAFAKSKVIDVELGTAGDPIDIADGAFQECSSLRTFTVNGNVSTLGYELFRSRTTPAGFVSPLTTITAPHVNSFLCNLSGNFPNLVSVDISGTTNFGSNAGLFKGCAKLTTVQLNTSAQSSYTLPLEMFKDCERLSSIDLSKVNLTRGHEFEGCVALTAANLLSASTISDYAFYGCSSLQNVRAPGALEIGEHAFDSTAIRNMVSGDFSNLHTIGDYAFANNSSLRNVVFANSVTIVGDHAFFNCPDLDNRDYSYSLDTANVESIGDNAFSGSSLVEIVVGSSLDSLGVGALNIETLSSISVDQGNTSFRSPVGSGMLYNSALTELILVPASLNRENVSLENTLTTIRSYAAYNADIRGTLRIPVSVTNIGDNAFSGTGISALIMSWNDDPDLNVVVGNGAFSDCASLTSLVLSYSVRYADVFTGSDNITSIQFVGEYSSSMLNYYTDQNYDRMPWYSGNSAIAVVFSSENGQIYPYMFYRDAGDGPVTSVTIPYGITRIGNYAFANCSGITSLSLPATMATLGENCLLGCSGITDLTAPISLDLAIDTDHSVGIVQLSSITFIAGTTSRVTDYTNTYTRTLWYNSPESYSVTFGPGISSTGNGLRLKASSLSISTDMRAIGTYAFTGSTFGTVDLKNVTSIGAYAFSDCDSLTSVTLPTGIESVGDYAFSGCDSLSRLRAPIHIAYTASMFNNCIHLSNFEFTYGGDGYGADYTSVALTPWKAAIDYATPLSPRITFINDTILSIGDYMFDGCYAEHGGSYGIEGTISLPSEIVSIGQYAFAGCEKITATNLSTCNSLVTIGAHAFDGCTALSGAIDLGSSVESVEEYAFRGCTSIESILIGDSVTSLGAGAFSNCTSATSLTIPISLNAVGSYMAPIFGGCTFGSVTFTGSAAGFDYSTSSTNNGYYRLTPWFISSTSSFSFSGVTDIGDNTFRECTAFTGNLVLPISVITIGDGSFYGTGISSVVGTRVESIGPSSFMGSSVTTVNMPRVTVVPDNAFRGCASMSKATFGDVTSIGDSAFKGSTVRTINNGTDGIVTLTSLRALGNSAFAESGVINVTLGSAGNGLSMGSSTFLGCPALTSLTINGVVDTISADTFRVPAQPFASALVSLTADHVTTFLADMSGFTSLETVSLADTTSYMNSQASSSFKGCTSLSSYTICNTGSPYVLIVLPASMFEGCSSLTGIDLGSVSLVNGREFYGCTSLTSVTVPMSAQIPAMSFHGCANLTSITAAAATSIGTSAFENCGLTNVESSSFPLLETVGIRAFYGCSDMTSFYSAATVTSIGSEAFKGTSLAAITGTLGNVTEVGADAFKGVSTLTGAISLVSATAVNDGAFDGTSVTSFTFGPGLATLGDLALRSPQLVSINFTSENPNFDMENGILFNEGKTTMIICPAKNEVHDLILPDTLVNILHYAAYGSSISGTLTLPDSIRPTAQVQVPVAEYAFAGSTGLTGLDIRYTGATVTAANAFEGCTGLTSLRVSNTVMLGDLFAYENRIASYTFFGGQSSGLENYYENNYQRMPWAFAADGVEISIVFESGSSVDKSMFRFASPNTSIVSVDLGTVSSIGSRAFMNCAGLRTLVIPDGVRVLDVTALAGCSGLRDITLPISLNVAVNNNGNVGELSLTSLHFTPGTGTGCSYENNYSDTLWYSATRTYNVYLDEGIESIGNNMYLKPLDNVTFPSTLRSIGANAFCNSSIDAVVLNEGLLTLGDNAFGNTPITRVTIPDSLVVSDTSAAPFKDCTQLASVSLPITINYANHMFDGCTNLTSFTFTRGENGVGYNYSENEAPLTIWYEICQTKDITVTFRTGIVSIGTHMFHGSAGPLGNGLSGTVNLSGITSVGAYAFSGCNNMSEVVFGDSMTTIGARAFESCTRLTSLTLGSSVRNLGNGSFYNCSSVRNLSVPASLDTVRNDDDPAFGRCTGIRAVELTGTSDGFRYSDAYGNNTWYQNTPWYIASNAGSAIGLTIGNGVPSIGKNTFRGCFGLDGTVNLPASVRSVGDYAFYECTGMDALEIMYSLSSIGKSAFAECSSLRSLTLPISINTVYYETDPVFAGTCNLESVSFTGTTGSAYSTSGSNNYRLTPWYNNTVAMTVSFDNSVQSVGAYTFCGCTHIQQDTVDLRNIGAIGESAFQDCSYIRGVTANKLVTAGRSSFEGCSDITQASMELLKVVPDNMFKDTEFMSTLTLHPNCTTIGAHAFENSGVRTLNSVNENTINLRSVTSIGEYAFAGSKAINVVLGTSNSVISTFGDNVFNDCQYLETVEIASTVNTLPYNTFRTTAILNYTPRLTTLTAKKVTNFYANLSEFRELTTVDIRGTTSFIPTGSQQYASFKGCTSLTTVTLYNESATSAKYTLPMSMFEGCTDLSTINLTYANISNQNGREFYGCTNLPSAGMLYTGTIADYSFYGCTSLTSISAPRASSIGSYAFAGSGLLSIGENDLSSVTQVNSHAFDSCLSLVTVTMNKLDKVNGTTEVTHDQTGAYTDVFYGCANLTTVRMDLLNGISSAMFYGCNKLSSVTADKVKKIDVLAFYECGELSSVSFPIVTELGVADANVTFTDGAFTGVDSYSVFYNCRSLSYVSMPKIESIGALAFYRCASLTSFNDSNSFVFGDTVDGIGTAAFAGTGTTSVTIGETAANGMKRISDYAFFACSQMTTFTSLSLIELPEHLFNNSDVNARPVDSQLNTINVPAATKFYANLHGITSLTTVRMTAATEFGDAIFYGCTGLSTVELKDSGTVNLSARMFYNCAALDDINLEAVRLPVNTQILNSGSTFYGCTSLRTVTLNICEIIPAGAFSGCTNLRTINLPNVTAVGKGAFNGCVAMTTVVAPKLMTVEENGFYGCTSLGQLNPNDDDVSGFIRITSIGSYAFYGCAFTKAVLGPQLTQMGAYAFSNNRLLNYVVLPNSLQTLNEGTFYGCPITEAYISSSITSIGSRAFDYGITDVTQASFYFNGSLTGITVSYNAINCSNKVRLSVYATHDSAEAFDGLCRDDKINLPDSRDFTGLDFGIVRIDTDDDRILPYVNNINVLYGSRFVLPYYSSGTGYVDYYFATLNGGLSLFASENDFENGRVARSGDDVPLFPLEDGGGLDFTGYNDLIQLEGKDTITIITNGNGNAVRPESVVVHYGSLYTIPRFENEQTHVSSITLTSIIGNLDISISETTTQIYIGYAFNEISMQSANTNVTVYFLRDGERYSAEVLLRSHFQYPDSLKDHEGNNTLEIPSPGYEFVGWYSAASGGYKAGEDTLFKNGQTWYARFEALSYLITVMDSGGTYATTTVTGPYVLYNTEGNLYYTDLNHDAQTLIIKKNDIEGYWIELYMDSGYKTIETGSNTGQLVDNRSVVVKKNINYYTVNMQFLYNGSPVANDVVFTMNGWGIGSERTYTNASAPISNVPFTIFKNGLVTPAPLSDNYTLSQLIVNDMVVSLRDSQYVVDKTYLTNSLDVNFIFVLTEGQYAVEFRIGDDAGTVVNNGIAYSEHDTITMIADNNYSRVGYTFVGFSIAGHDGTLLPMTQIALTREMINQSQYCVVTAEGVWAEIDYTIRFDLAGYTGANPPASIENVIIGDTITLPDTSTTYRIGQTISGWHFIIGENASSVSHSGQFILDKTMIEGYADSNRVITMQCEWLAKSYIVRVDPNAGTKQFLPMNNIQYGDTVILWDIGSYSRSFMMFGGWSVGENGTKFPSAASARVDDELAYYGDTHEGMITFYFYWVPYEYNVQYRLDGGEGDAPVDNNVYEVNNPETPLVLADSTGFERAGYTFVGWRYSLDSSAIYINTSGLFESILAQNADSNGIVTLYAVWSQKEYLIEYNLKGGVAGPYAPQSAMYGEDFFVSAPTQSGFDFAGWRATTNATENGLLTKGAQYFSSSSYKLWDGSRTVNVSTFRDLCSVDSGKVTFEAMWSNASYSVSYDKNGGSGTIVGGMNNIRIKQAIVMPQFTDAEKTGYTFVGWSVDGVNPIAPGTEFTTSMVEGGVNTVVFYAVWETNPYTVQYRYTPEQNYISTGTTYTAEFNIPTYERAGYAFDGWEITGADSNAYWSPDGDSWYKLGNAKVTGTYFKNLTSIRGTTVTINALWKPLQYRISYSSNGGTGVAPVDSNLYMVGSDVTLKDYHVLDGTNGNKTIIGWSLDAKGSVTSFKTFTEGLAGRADATGTVNLYAVWAEGLCTVTIDLTGITVSEVPAGWVDIGDGKYSTTVEYGTSMKDVMSGWESVSLMKDGYAFTGWNYGNGTVVGNAEVEPTFEEVDMSVAYIFGGAVAAVVAGIFIVSRFKF